MLTQERLKELIGYNPATGRIARKRKTAWNAGKGSMSRGYKIISLDGKQYFQHRIAFLYVHGYLPKEIDHVNHKRNDNRIVNLVAADRTGNCRNMSMKKNNKSGVNGVHWNKAASNWRAQISVKAKVFCLGSFNNLFDAVCARRSAESRLGYHSNHGRVSPFVM